MGDPIRFAPVKPDDHAFSVSADQLTTAAQIDALQGDDSHRTEIYDGGHQLLAVKVINYEGNYSTSVSLIRRDGLIIHETSR